MKRLFTAMLVGFSAVSFANVEANGPFDTKMFTKEVNENKSYYETLGEMFQRGAKPEASKLMGVLWSGRCFKKTEPFEPINGAYHFKRKRNQDVGPIGDSVVSYEAVSWWKPSLPPNYFDNKTISEVVKSSDKFYRVFDSENSIAIKFNNDLSNLRFSGKYLIEELSETKVDVGPLGEGYQVWGRCYYFIPEYAR